MVIAFSLASPPLYTLSEADLSAFAAELAAREPNFGVRLAAVAQASLGMPYSDGPLGEGPDGRYDHDPLIDFSKADCVTFVEQSIALAASSSYPEVFDTLQRIRYRDGVVDFGHRNHFMLADWIPHNRFCRDVSREACPNLSVEKRTIGRKKLFVLNHAPDLADAVQDEPMEAAYIPAGQVAAVEKKLPSPALICFIGKADWLFVVHCGLYIRGEDGQGHLIHASSKEGKVVQTGLAAFATQPGRYLGITAYAH